MPTEPDQERDTPINTGAHLMYRSDLVPYSPSDATLIAPTLASLRAEPSVLATEVALAVGGLRLSVSRRL
jgi:hypothetical protein